MARRRGAPVLAALLLSFAACGGEDVRTESADASAATAPASTDAGTPTTDELPDPTVPTTDTAAAPSTSEPSTTPFPTTTTPSPPTSADPAGPVSTSEGDTRYPELGSADLDVQS
ncbi:MAG: hypothetical protein ABW219_01625, partial [Ilumatobacteraceae bacterium]